jgi:hypothetical protein
MSVRQCRDIQMEQDEVYVGVVVTEEKLLTQPGYRRSGGRVQLRLA